MGEDKEGARKQVSSATGVGASEMSSNESAKQGCSGFWPVYKAEPNGGDRKER